MIRHLDREEINTLALIFKQMDERRLAERPDYCGIPGIKFIFHNTWADPTLIYKGEEFNIHVVEDALWEMYQEDGYDNENCFGGYISDHADDVYEILDTILESRKENVR